MKKNLTLNEEISRIKGIIIKNLCNEEDNLQTGYFLFEQWKPLGSFAADIISRAKLTGKYVAKTISNADDVLSHFSTYKSLWRTINPAYKVKTIENVISNVVSGKNSPFELVNGSPLYRAIPVEGNLRYNVIQAWRIKNSISDDEFKKLIGSVSAAEKKSIPTVTTTKVLDPKTAPAGTVWKNTLTVEINGKSQIFTGKKFIKNTDGTISKFDGAGKEVDRIDINKMELDANKIPEEQIDDFTREIIDDIEDQVDDIESTVTGDEVVTSMDKKDKKLFLRYFLPDNELFNKTYNIIRSFGGVKNPETYLGEVKNSMDNFLETYFKPYIERNIDSLDTMSPASLQQFNSNLRKLIMDFDLARKNTETYDQLWLSLKSDFLKSVDDMPVESYLTKQEAAKLISKRKQLANKIISMCEKGTGEKGTYNSINKFLEVMRPTTEDYSIFPSGIEKSAWYDLKSFSRWSGLSDEWEKITKRFSEAMEKGGIKSWLKAIFGPLLDVINAIGNRLVSYLITEAPLNFRKLTKQFKNTFRQGITAKKFGLLPEYLYEAVVTYIKWCFGKLIMLPFINMVDSLIEWCKAKLGYEPDARYAAYSPFEELMRGWTPLIEESGEWKKLFVTFGIGPGLEKIGDILATLWDRLRNMESSGEEEKILDNDLQEKLEKLGLEQDQIEMIKDIENPIERNKKIVQFLNDQLKEYKTLDEKYKPDLAKKFPSRMIYLKDSLQKEYGEVKGKSIFNSISIYFLFTDETEKKCIAYDKNFKPLTLNVSNEGIYAEDNKGKKYVGEDELSDFGVYVYNNRNSLLSLKNIKDSLVSIPKKITTYTTQKEMFTPIINKLIKEMNEGKKFGEDNFKHWKDTFKFKKYDEKTNHLKDVKITAKMDEIMDRIDHFRKKYDEDDSFVRAVIDVYGTGIDIIQYTKGLAHLTEGVIVGGLLGVLSTIRESKELVTWTVKHYKDGNWELVKGNFNKKELLNVGKTKRERDERQKESDNPAEGLKKKEQESIMILSRDEKEGLNGLPTKVKQKVKEKLRQGWTTEKPFDFLNTYYSESEINSVFNDKIKIYKLKPSAEFFRSLAKNSSKVTVKKGFCKSVKNAKGEYDLSEREKNTLNHFISKCESKFGV